MTSSPHISVILANYDGERYLRECVGSVLAQSYDDFEFIIVDDGSTDGSPDILEEFARGEPTRIQFLRLSENQGQGEGFNRGVAASKGRLVCFLDSDDFWFPEKLATVAATFGDDKVVALHQHHLALVRGGVVTSERVRSTLVVGDVCAEAQRTKALPGFVPTSGLTFSRRALDQVLPVPRDFRVCADGFLTRTAMCYGRVSAADVACGAYRAHEGNATYENPGFNMRNYFRDLLYPQLNRFYQSHGIPLEFRIDPPVRPQLGMLRIANGDRVLMVRSAPVERIQSVLTALFEDFPGIAVDLLVQPGFAEEFTDSRVEALFLPEGLLPARGLPKMTQDVLRARQYVCALIPYNEVDGLGYSNVHEALRQSQVSCPMVGIGTRGGIFPVA